MEIVKNEDNGEENIKIKIPLTIQFLPVVDGIKDEAFVLNSVFEINTDVHIEEDKYIVPSVKNTT